MQNNENKSQKTYTQQILHKEFFQARPRSFSFSGRPSSDMQSEDADLWSPPGQTDIFQQQKDEQPINEWQRDKVPNKKRKRPDSPTESVIKQKYTRQVNYKVPVRNQFDILSDEDPEIAPKTKEYIPKPEPIFVTDIVNITPLRELIVIVKFIVIDKFTTFVR
ncbi:unnamed protein product [Parnassius apollo]|uniref:(apollo) hypothetical protein n=1 Tax=Parnassius apollo TaxID=110799 RepID=A0A8S3X4F7_PARAO|nr:unnamed protein product [Parnassius apollo]